MPYSYAQLTGNGAATAFNFSFPYLERAHIGVKVNGTVTAFSFLTDFSVSITPAPANGAIVEIRRTTPMGSVPVDFADGSPLSEADLDLLATFNLYCNQEAYDAGQDSMILNASGRWDGEGKRAVNFADPVDAQDLATRKWALDNESTFTGQALAALTDFKHQYQGALASDPATRFDGSALQAGDLFFNTFSMAMKVWNGVNWTFAGSTIQATLKRPSTPVLATAGQTVVAVPGGYDPLYIQVYLNGALLSAPDVDISGGSNIVFATPLNLNDEVDYVAFGSFLLADTYSRAEVNTHLAYRLSRAIDLWLTSEENYERFYFANQGPTFVRGHGTNPVRFQSSNGLNVGYFTDTGELVLTHQGTTANSATRLDQLIDLQNQIWAPGLFVDAAWTTPPAGLRVLRCNGQAPALAAYPNLISIYCGDGQNATAAWGYRCTDPANPSTTRSTSGTHIVLPKTAGRFRRDLTDNTGINNGRTLWEYEADDNKSHSHTPLYLHGSSRDNQDAGNFVGTVTSGVEDVGIQVNVDSYTGNSGGAEARPYNYACTTWITY